MYPVLRMAKEIWKFRNAPRLGPGDAHISHHRCWPHDLDFWLELNNGRTLTMMDLGRIPLVNRVGLTRAMRQNKWGMTVAGSSVRYRRRIRGFDRVEQRSRILGWDRRFFYIEQSMWSADGVCANNGLFRMAVTSPKGIVPPEKAAEAMGLPNDSPPLPNSVTAWIEAEEQRAWPPST